MAPKSAGFSDNTMLNNVAEDKEQTSASLVVGSDVLTRWGRGKVIEIRDDLMETHAVKLSSWRLAGRSSVICYVSRKECQAMRPKKIYDMDVFEKIEHANELKELATSKFMTRDYTGSLELFARALDSVRYVQHKADSTNEVRADLIVVMITCSNNAALCSSKKGDWERAAKFAANALVLIEALEEKGNESKIKTVINNDGIGDSQLFGTWKVKSLLLIAKSMMERHDTSKTTSTLKKAMEAISVYKKEGDQMYKQLSTQEKDIRRLRLEFSRKTREARIKEKKQAKAMFGGNEEHKHVKKNDISNNETTVQQKEKISGEIKTEESELSKNRATRKEDCVPVGFNGDEDDDYSHSSFIEEHSEALLILSCIAVGWFVVKMVTKRK